MRKYLAPMFVVAALSAAACGGKGTAPTAPSTGSTITVSPGGPASPSAATGEAEVKGTVEALTGASTFTVAGKTVTTNASTVFTDGPTNTFADLKVGTRVEVKGTLSGAAVTATRVEIQDAAEHAPNPGPAPQPNPMPPVPGPNPAPAPKEAEFTGTISGLTGTASAFQFTVGSQLVKGDATTSILGHSDTAKAFADLKNGATVEVKGVQQTGFVQASRIKLEDEDDADEVKVDGTLGAVSGTCPAIASTVTATKFTTSASTRFDDACAGFKSGDKVEVRGSMQSDGSLAATRLRKR